MKKIFLLLLALYFVQGILYAQQLQRQEIINAYIYNFTKNIEWQNEDQISEFNFIIVSEDQKLIEEFKKISDGRELKGKEIKTSAKASLTEADNIHLIFIAGDKGDEFVNIFNLVEGKNCLLVSDNYTDQRIVMINFIDIEDKKIQFEINKANIINQGITILPEMVLLGGTEIDVAQLYYESQQSLRQQQRLVDQMNDSIVSLNIFMQQTSATIDQQLTKIDSQVNQISQYKIRADKQKDSLQSQQIRISSQLEQLNEQQTAINLQNNQLSQLSDSIENVHQELLINNDLLEQGKVQLKEMDKQIELKNLELDQQTETITRQQFIIVSVGIIVILLISLAVIIYRQYRTKKRTNEQLEVQKDKLQLTLEELQSTQKQLEKAKQEAESANRAKSTFLANMSHELRTPLNSILGFAQIINRDRTLPEKHKKNIEIINRSGEYLLTLINQVLDLSKVEAGKIELNEGPVDLHGLLAEMDSLFRVRIQEKGLEFDFQQEEALPHYIISDEVKLRQVMLNLISNAIKFTKEGKISLIVKSEKTSDEKDKKTKLYFEVMDTGAGISKEEIKMLFQAFVQTESGQKTKEGTGLGLAISFRFVKLLGGELKVISTQGKGSSFYFEIPVQKGEESKVHEIRKHKFVVGVAKGQQKKKILIVDDIEDNRNMLDKLLNSLAQEGEAEPFEIRTAANGQEATEISEEWKPQLIFMDMRMPVMDGYEASKKIKSSAKSKAPIIIALTASVYEQEHEKALNSGCNDIVRKPFHDFEIFDVLEKYLGIEFIYETKVSKEHKAEDELSAKINSLPEELKLSLKEAAEELNIEESKEIITRIEKTDKELADHLFDLVEEFRFDVLQKLISDNHE